MQCTLVRCLTWADNFIEYSSTEHEGTHVPPDVKYRIGWTKKTMRRVLLSCNRSDSICLLLLWGSRMRRMTSVTAGKQFNWYQSIFIPLKNKLKLYHDSQSHNWTRYSNNPLVAYELHTTTSSCRRRDIAVMSHSSFGLISVVFLAVTTLFAAISSFPTAFHEVSPWQWK